MPRPPSIQWYYKQYLGDNKVLAMDWDVRGMHVHLLMLSIQEEPPGTIPADDAAIRRWLSLPLGSVESDQTWRRVKSQLLAAWQPEGDRLVNSGMRSSCERQARYRERYETGTKKPPNNNEVEERSKDVDFEVGSKEESPPQNSDELVEKIARTHPRNWREKGDLGMIPNSQADAIIRAIQKDGIDLVLAGTRNYAEAVNKWPMEGRGKSVKGVERFFNESDYLKNPKEWEQGNDRPVSNQTERLNRNREGLKSALERRYGGADVGSGSDDHGVQGTDAERGRLLAGKARKVSAGGNQGGI